MEKAVLPNKVAKEYVLLDDHPKHIFKGRDYYMSQLTKEEADFLYQNGFPHLEKVTKVEP